MKQRKYTHGDNIGTTIRLYYQHGIRRRYVEIPRSKAPWYFYITKDDFKRHKSALQYMKRAGDVLGVKAYGKGFVKVFTVNQNLPPWKIEAGETDAKMRTLATLSNLGIPTFEADLSSLDRYCIDNNTPIEDDYLIGYFDIETDDRVNSFEPGAGRILSMAVVDNYGKVTYLTSRNELRLLKRIVATLKKYAIIVGFNSKEFDLPYIKARCSIYGIEFNTYNQIHIDMWQQFRRLYRYNKDGPPNYSLNALSKHFLNENKLDFGNDEGYHWNWVHNHEVFKKYNIRDVQLLRELDEKVEVITTMAIQCKLCGIYLNRFWNTRLTDMYLLRLAKSKDMCLPTNKEQTKVPMTGGRVLPIVPGVYDNVYIWDFSQMYSTIMRSFNISPETYALLRSSTAKEYEATQKIDAFIKSPLTLVMKVVIKLFKEAMKLRGAKVIDGDVWWEFQVHKFRDVDYVFAQDYVFTRLQQKITLKHYATVKYFLAELKLKQYRSKDKKHIYYDMAFAYTKQPVFYKQPISLVAEMLATYVEKRDEAKAMMEKYTEGSPEWKLWNQYNIAYKLMGNVAFGYMSSHLTRAYHHALACTITMAGQIIIGMLRKDVPKRFKGALVIYSDTDSIFIIVPRLTRRRLPAFDKAFRAWFKPYLTSQLKKYFNVDTHCMAIEPDKFFEHLLLVKKKNYSGYNAETGEFKTMGLDFVKRDTIKYTKHLQEFLVKACIIDKRFRDSGFVREWCSQQRDTFFAMTLNEKNLRSLVIRKTLTKKPEDYKTDPLHVRIAKRALAAGEQVFVGNVMEYVLIESECRIQEGEQIDRFLANGKLTINLKAYWSSQIYSKLKRILDCVFPNEEWDSIDPEAQAKRQKRINDYKAWFTKAKNQERRDTLYTRMLALKCMHPADKRMMQEWMDEENITVTCVDEPGSKKD